MGDCEAQVKTALERDRLNSQGNASTTTKGKGQMNALEERLARIEADIADAAKGMPADNIQVADARWIIATVRALYQVATCSLGEGCGRCKEVLADAIASAK